MIRIRYLEQASPWVIALGYSFLGPIHTDGSQEWESLSYRHHSDKLMELPGIFGENDVFNRQVEADVVFDPTMINIHSTGSFSEVSVDYKDGNIKKSATAPYGYYQSKSYRMVDGQSTYLHVYVFLQDGVWSVITLDALRSNPTKISSWNRYMVSNIHVSGSTLTGTKSAWCYSRGRGISTSTDWSLPQNGEELLAVELICAAQVTRSNFVPDLKFYKLWDLGDSSFSLVEDRINHLFSEIYSAHPCNNAWTDYGDLATSASADYAGTHLNLIEFLRDIRKPWELIPKLKNFKRLSLDLKSLKKISNEYLRVHYGVLPTIRDIKTLWSFYDRKRPYYDKHGYESVHSGSSEVLQWFGRTIEVTRRLKIAIMNVENPLLSSLESFDSIGLLPNVDNIWELIPFSFVVDWIVPIGDMLEACTAQSRISRYRIPYTTMSHKEVHTQTLSGSSATIVGTIQVVMYHRWTIDHCPLPRLSLQPNTTGSNHWLEASALILQRR